MKATELMIGDWVHVEAHRGFNAQNVKVETIPDNDGDNKYGHHYGHIGTWLDGGDNDFRDVEVKHLQPIPLTSEILEKNGFILKEEEEGLYGVVVEPYYSRDDVPFEVFCDGEPFAIWFKDPVNIKYVHQLQHALRLCEIEKEIVL